MQRRFSATVLVGVAVLSLGFGTLAGGAAGGLAGYWASGRDPATTPAAVLSTVAPTPDHPTPVPTKAPDPTEQPSASRSPGASDAVSVADVVAQVAPAVVTVLNKQVAPGASPGSKPQLMGTGTGFVIDTEGHVVTNNHVVEGSQELSVIFADGTQASAKLLGTDRFADLAVVQVAGPIKATLPFGDSSALRPGEHVIAIGSPLGDFTNTVTDGIISALHRELETGDGFNMEDMIQHDAPINPGNSGGPLLTLDGKVVGVNTAKVDQAEPGVAAEGLGFAIPSSTVKEITEQIIATGKVERPYLGIVYDTINPRQASSDNLPVDHGVIVREIQPGSPAASADIHPGDIVTKLDDTAIDASNPLVNLLFRHKVGEAVKLEIYRVSDKQTLTVTVTLAPKPDNS
ncbi:MAG TPA: trypsin-like peptidase domain-containing protein [Nitrolancea sp.]|nr:trypsin-like peptidase domain-containing protein [Nitrolancea sp.]